MRLTEVQKYTEYLFNTALKKCGNISDAEDLAQEVLLVALQSTAEISNIKSWLSVVLNHKYYDMLRRKYKLPTISIDFIPDESECFHAEEVENCPDSASVRREVSYLADKYRTVIVRHYLNGESVRDIAESLGVPKGTVLSRLSSGREQMRKGFEKMESYERYSYQPERLEISYHGKQGFHGEPFSLTVNDLMKQNIMIVAYQKPLTAVEISRAMGIPTAYIENAIKDLVSSELMKQVNNKYFTDFMIIKPEQLLKGLDVEISLAEAHYTEILNFINNYLSTLQSSFFRRFTETQKHKLEYYFILHLFSSALYTATQRIVPSKEEYPQRPDGGRWIAVGTQFPQNFDYKKYRFGKYCYGGERISYDENYLGAKSIHLHLYDSQPDLNKYEHGPVEMHDDILVKLLYIILREIPFEYTGFETMFLEDIPHLAECGILGIDNGKPFVDLPILTPDEYSLLDKTRIEYMHKMANMLEPWLREIFPLLKTDIPKHLEGRVAEFRQYSCYAIPMAFIKKAVEQKEFDIQKSTPPMVFVVDDRNENFGFNG